MYFIPINKNIDIKNVVKVALLFKENKKLNM